jgi:hypothetical protein
MARNLELMPGTLDMRLMDQIAHTSVATPKVAFLLVGLFAGLAIILAMIGRWFWQELLQVSYSH